MSGVVAPASVERAASMLRDRLGERVRTDVPLAPRPTYRVGGRAALFAEVSSSADLEAVADAHRASKPVAVAYDLRSAASTPLAEGQRDLS